MEEIKKLFKKNDKGQALILIIIVLFIVFFLVVSVSENISIDTVNTSQNQKFQKAFAAATTGLADGKNCILNLINHNVPCPSSKNIKYGQGYQYEYTTTSDIFVNQTVSNDQIVQADVTNAPAATVNINNSNSILVVNVIFASGNIINWNGNNLESVMCVYYPASLTSDSTTTNYVNLNSFNQGPSQVCGSTIQMTPTKGIYTANINLSIGGGNIGKYLRAYVVNYYSNQTTNIKIYPSSVNTVQEYNITVAGTFGGSRRVLTTTISAFGTPPGVFDYALFNGGQGASIVF